LLKAIKGPGALHFDDRSEANELTARMAQWFVHTAKGAVDPAFEANVAMLEGMGFPSANGRIALKKANNDVAGATDVLFSASPEELAAFAVEQEAESAGKKGGKRWQAPIVPTLLDTYFGQHDTFSKSKTEFGWGKDGTLYLDVSKGEQGFPILSVWVLIKPKVLKDVLHAKLTERDLKNLVGVDRGLKLRFRLDSIVGDEALFQVVAETTEKERIKDVFTSNGFRDCVAGMEKEIAQLRDYKPMLPITDASKSYADRVMRMTIKDALEVKNSEAYKAGNHFAKDNVSRMFGKWRRTEYTQASDAFARWYFYIMQQCHKSSAAEAAVCQRWKGAFGAHEVARPNSEGYKMNNLANLARGGLVRVHV